MTLNIAVAQVAPLYNLAFVLVGFILFIKLFTMPVRDRRAYNKPWVFIFLAMMIFLTEEIITILRAVDAINIPIHINGFFELMIIIMFIYALLLQKERINQTA